MVQEQKNLNRVKALCHGQLEPHGRDSTTIEVLSDNLEKQSEKATQSEDQRKNFKDHTIKELLVMKEDVDKLYGKGVFKKHVRIYIVKQLGLNKVLRYKDDTEKILVEDKIQKETFCFGGEGWFRWSNLRFWGRCCCATQMYFKTNVSWREYYGRS